MAGENCCDYRSKNDAFELTFYLGRPYFDSYLAHGGCLGVAQCYPATFPELLDDEVEYRNKKEIQNR